MNPTANMYTVRLKYYSNHNVFDVNLPDLMYISEDKN